MKTVLTAYKLTRKRELASALSVVGIILITFIVILIYIFNFLPRTVNLAGIYGSDNNFQEIRSNIAKANQTKLYLEKSIQNEESKFKFKNSEKYYQELISQAKSNGLKILSFEEMGTFLEDDLVRSNISLEMSGFYSGLVKYIKQLETDVYPVTVRSLNISASNSVSTDLRCEVTFSIYRNKNE